VDDRWRTPFDQRSVSRQKADLVLVQSIDAEEVGFESHHLHGSET
jgi:hypothetical protein